MNKLISSQLLIFFKNPILGKVKSRIAKTEGEKAALRIYLDLLKKCRQEALKVNAERHLFYADYIPEMDDWSLADFHKFLQIPTGSLGDKMKQAFSISLKNQLVKTVIIGSDCYDLSAEIIESAFLSLDKNDVVIGPANDGGYYLLGMKRFHPALFEGIDWSTERVLSQTIEKAKRENLDFALLEELIDLDTIEDVKKSSYPYPFEK